MMTYLFRYLLCILLLSWSTLGHTAACSKIYLIEGIWVYGNGRWSVEKMPKGIVLEKCAKDWIVNHYGFLVMGEKENYYTGCLNNGRWEILNLRPMKQPDIWFYIEYPNGVRVNCDEVYTP